MLIVPEARAAIVRASVFVTVALVCIAGASFARPRWARMIFLLVAIPATFEAVFGIWAIWLVMHYGPG
jgi:hypothetical protein